MPAKRLFRVCAGLLLYAQAGYGAALALVARLRPARPGPSAWPQPPTVSLIVAAYREQEVIGPKVTDALAQHYPRERFEVVVAVDGADAGTARGARAAGADAVLELPRAGKVRAQDAAVARSRADVVAFSDANATWSPDALAELVAPLADPAVGYVCGQVSFTGGEGNQEGLYWRYEMALRGLESRLASVTGGNGAIYAVRRAAYVEVDPVMGHDLSLPFTLVKRGWRAVYEPRARATERMVPTIEGEWARKRRMMSHAWPIVVRGGLLSPRGYGPLYAWMILSHRVLRYLTPFLHLALLGASLRLAPRSRPHAAALAGQGALLAAAAAGARRRSRPLLLARYYVLTTAAIAAGAWDWLRHGTEPGWEQAGGTR